MKHREWRCACLMLKVYIREDLLYKKSELLKALDFSENNERDKASYNKLINELKRKRLLKTRRKKGSRESLDDDASLISEDDVDFDDCVGDEGDCIQYLFRFVGVIFHDDRIINVYPKYVESGNRLEDHMRQVINVIRKHQGKLYRLDVSAILEEIDRGEEITELSIILFLINDYSRNGLYFETEKITEYNGYGDIQWGKTVENITPVMTNNRPIYMDVLTCKRKDNDFNYFVRLHKYILTEASNELEKTDLTEFFSLPQIELSNDEYSDFGDTEYILNVIDAEMGRQFDDRKLAVLHAMYLYIRQKKAATIHYMKSSDEGLRFFGTRAFHKVWEDVIDSVYVSQKDLSFGEIKTKYVNTLDYTFNLPNGSSCLVQANQNLGSIIEKPEWHLKDSRVSSKCATYLPSGTFVPDYLKFNAARDTFYIIDAKYYLPRWYVTNDGEYKIEKQPGVEDVVKQYMYYLAYKPLLENNMIDIRHVENYYVMPTEGEDEDSGYVKIDFLAQLLPDVFNIRVKRINAEKLFDHYLHDEVLDVSTMPNS